MLQCVCRALTRRRRRILFLLVLVIVMLEFYQSSSWLRLLFSTYGFGNSANMNQWSMVRNINERMFAKQTAEQAAFCKYPVLSIDGQHNYVDRSVARRCRVRSEWGKLVANRWHLTTEKAKSLNVNCKYRNVTRQNDFELIYSPYATLSDGQLITCDVIEVVCAAFEPLRKGSGGGGGQLRAKSNALFVQIVDRLKHMPETLPPARPAPTMALKATAQSTCQPMNIVLLSYDSLSRVSWFKRLPKTTRYALDTMGFELLYGQSILGDGTPACMIPLLTGFTEGELPSTTKTDPKATFVGMHICYVVV